MLTMIWRTSICQKKSTFSAPVSDDRMREITKGSVPVAEHKEEHCMGVNIFLEWCAARNNLPDVNAVSYC